MSEFGQRRHERGAFGVHGEQTRDENGVLETNQTLCDDGRRC